MISYAIVIISWCWRVSYLFWFLVLFLQNVEGESFSQLWFHCVLSFTTSIRFFFLDWICNLLFLCPEKDGFILSQYMSCNFLVLYLFSTHLVMLIWKSSFAVFVKNSPIHITFCNKIQWIEYGDMTSSSSTINRRLVSNCF